MDLFKYQQEVLSVSGNKNAFAWFLETGTGKTIISLENMFQLWTKKKISAAIITAPKTVLKPVWIKSLGDFYSGKYKFYTFQWIGGISDSQMNILNRMIKTDLDPRSMLPIFLINIEAFSHKRVYAIVEQILRRYYTLWVMDESTTIKSPTTKRTKGILRICHLAEYKRILSGYPVLKSPEDLYSQIVFLGSNLIPYRSFYAFRNDFCILQKLDRRVTIVKGAQNLDRLNQIIQPFSIRLTKKQCLDLPEKIRTIRYVEMTDEQRSYYSQMKEQAYLTLKETKQEVFASTLLVQLEKLHQIANGWIASIAQHLPCNKYDVLEHLIRNEIGDNQFIVWSCYVENVLEISRMMNIPNLYGDIDKTLEGFFNKKYQGMSLNPAGYKFGQNFTNASYAIYFNNSFSLENRIQSEDRLHRYGQKNNVTYIDLITEDTIEEKILMTLEKQHNIGAQVLKDEWESWFN